MIEKPRKKRFGFYKQDMRQNLFVPLSLETLVEINKDARETLIGQGYIAAMMLDYIYKNPDIRRLFINKAVFEHHDYAELREYALEFAKEKKVQKGFPYYTFSQRRVKCVYCGKEQSEHFMQEHVRRLCPKAPKVKALPSEILLRVGRDMEVDAE